MEARVAGPEAPPLRPPRRHPSPARPRTRRRLALYAVTAAVIMVIAGQSLRLYGAAHQPLGAIVVLGGGIHRELAAARIATRIPYLPVIVSSGSPGPCVRHYFEELNGLEAERLVLDFRAGDTLTNFTATLPLLEAAGARRALVVTSQGHAPRALALAWIVWGSRGIVPEAALVAGTPEGESATKTALDVLRGLAWLVAGEQIVHGAYKPAAEVRAAAAAASAPCEPAPVTSP